MSDLYETVITPEYIDGVKETLKKTEKTFLRDLKAGNYDGFFKELLSRLEALPPKSEEEQQRDDEKFISRIESQYNIFKQKYPTYEVDFWTFYAALFRHPEGRELIGTFINEIKNPSIPKEKS